MALHFDYFSPDFNDEIVYTSVKKRKSDYLNLTPKSIELAAQREYESACASRESLSTILEGNKTLEINIENGDTSDRSTPSPSDTTLSINSDIKSASKEDCVFDDEASTIKTKSDAKRHEYYSKRWISNNSTRRELFSDYREPSDSCAEFNGSYGMQRVLDHYSSSSSKDSGSIHLDYSRVTTRGKRSISNQPHDEKSAKPKSSKGRHSNSRSHSDNRPHISSLKTEAVELLGKNLGINVTVRRKSSARDDSSMLPPDKRNGIVAASSANQHLACKHSGCGDKKSVPELTSESSVAPTPNDVFKEFLASVYDGQKVTDSNRNDRQVVAVPTQEPISNAVMMEDNLDRRITSAVSYECDKIRQLMYQQHLSLIKFQDQKMDEMKEMHSKNVEDLCVIIAELLNENAILRNIIREKY